MSGGNASETVLHKIRLVRQYWINCLLLSHPHTLQLFAFILRFARLCFITDSRTRTTIVTMYGIISTRSAGAFVSCSWLETASATPKISAHSMAPMGEPPTIDEAHRPMYPRPATMSFVNDVR